MPANSDTAQSSDEEDDGTLGSESPEDSSSGSLSDSQAEPETELTADESSGGEVEEDAEAPEGEVQVVRDTLVGSAMSHDHRHRWILARSVNGYSQPWKKDKFKTQITKRLQSGGAMLKLQEERDLIRAWAELPPLQLKDHDQAIKLLENGLGFAVSACVARRAAEFADMQRAKSGEGMTKEKEQQEEEKRQKEKGGKWSRKAKVSPGAAGRAAAKKVQSTVDRVLKSKRLLTSQKATDSLLSAIEHRRGDALEAEQQVGKSGDVVSLRRTEDGMPVELAEDSQLQEWAESWLMMPSARRDKLPKDFQRFRQSVEHRFTCWHAGQVGSGFISTTPRPPSTPRSARGSRGNKTGRHTMEDALFEGSEATLLPDLLDSRPSSKQAQRSHSLRTKTAEEEELKDDSVCSSRPIRSRGAVSSAVNSLMGNSTGFDGSTFGLSQESREPHGLFREVHVLSSRGGSQQSQHLQLAPCPRAFREPHRVPECAGLNAMPEFCYLRTCELAGLVPCQKAWMKFSSGEGIVDAAGCCLADPEVLAVVETAVDCASQGHYLGELNLSGNVITDEGLKKVAALLVKGKEAPKAAAAVCTEMPDEHSSLRSGMMITSLNLASNTGLQFRASGLVESVGCALSSMPALTFLDFSFVEALHGRVVVSLANALGEFCPNLSSLALANCGLGCRDQSDCVAVAALLSQGRIGTPQAGFKGLQSADLSGNFFGLVGLTAVGAALRNSRLEQLSFAGNCARLAERDQKAKRDVREDPMPPASQSSIPGTPRTQSSSAKRHSFVSPEQMIEEPALGRNSLLKKDKVAQNKEVLPSHSQVEMPYYPNPMQIFIEGIQVNNSLEKLDISSCNIGPDTMWVLQQSLRFHDKMRYLRLGDNPLGEQGLRHAIHLLALSGSKLEGVVLTGVRESEPGIAQVKFRHALPQGNYRFNLSYPHERATLRTLLSAAERKFPPNPFRYLKYHLTTTKTAKDSRSSERLEKEGGVWVVPNSGLCNVSCTIPLSRSSYQRATYTAGDSHVAKARTSLLGQSGKGGAAPLLRSGDDKAVTTQPMSRGTGHHDSTARSPSKKTSASPPRGGNHHSKQKVIVEETRMQTAAGLPGTPEGNWFEVAQLFLDGRMKVTTVSFFALKQVYNELVTDEERLRFAKAISKEIWCTVAQAESLIDCRKELAVQLVPILFPCIASRSQQLSLLEQVLPVNLKKAARAVGPSLWFQEGNPTGSYNLDLSDPVDYLLAESCLLVNAWESESARYAGRADVSQSGNGEMLRNEAYNETRFVYARTDEWTLPGNGWFRFDYSSIRRPHPDAKSMKEVNEIVRHLRNKAYTSETKLQALRAVSVYIVISTSQCRSLVQCFPSPQESMPMGEESPERQEAFCILHTRVTDRERLLSHELLYSPKIMSTIGLSRRAAAAKLREAEDQNAEVEAARLAKQKEEKRKKKKKPAQELPDHVMAAMAFLPKQKRQKDGKRGALLVNQRQMKLLQRENKEVNVKSYQLIETFQTQDVICLHRRLGHLQLLNPLRVELMRAQTDLSVYETHRLVEFMRQLAQGEAGGRVLCWLEDGRQASLPASWASKGVPRTNLSFTVSYESITPCTSYRQALAENFCIGFMAGPAQK
eukprot:TRINITY_DN27836_c0_g2_i1.p1 TRINITY_DN27836_c0_g2~~TRINITY_DN27836_c0_g2_i1.p1  ORF type:complete len:1614 (-),score=365.88 TRINITY_DN27836_c0_g2_i1:150-4991(-)